MSIKMNVKWVGTLALCLLAQAAIKAPETASPFPGQFVSDPRSSKTQLPAS
jgi:hypothetical protein